MKRAAFYFCFDWAACAACGGGVGMRGGRFEESKTGLVL
jgi:hypothetical protein